MSTQVSRRKGTSVEIASFTPVLGEIIYNETTKTLHLGDGATVGGIPLANPFSLIGNTFNAVIASGTADALLITPPSVPDDYQIFQEYIINPVAPNTGPMTLQVGPDLLPVAIQKHDGAGAFVDLEPDDVRTSIPFRVLFDGTRWILQQGGGGGGGSGSWELFTETEVSASVASVDLIDIFEEGFDYEIIFEDVVGSASNREFALRFSDDIGGAIFEAANYHVIADHIHATLGAVSVRSTALGFISLSNQTGNIGTQGISGRIFLFDPAKASVLRGTFQNESTNRLGQGSWSSGGFQYSTIDYQATSARFFWNTTGNIIQGNFRVYRRAIA